MDLELLSLLPIIICLILILITKNAFVSILSGLLTGSLLLFITEGATFTVINGIVAVATDAYQFKIIGFIMLTGALVGAIQASGGITGVIQTLNRLEKGTRSKVGSQLFLMLIGCLMFMDGTSSMAVTAVVGRPIFKQLKLPKEKLALLVNSTSAPIAWLIPFGGAGAMVAGALSETGVPLDDPFSYVVSAVGFQFYTLALLILLATTILLKIDLGPIKHMVYVDEALETPSVGRDRARNMIFPVVVLIVVIFSLLFYTGEGNILKGDGATSIFTAGCITLLFTAVFYRIQNLGTFSTILSWFFNGMRLMLEISLLLLIAFAFGDMIQRLGTASYLVQVTNFIPTQLLPLAVLLLSAIIAFSTGTSSGTVAIMTPLMIPIVVSSGGSIPLAIGALISGAVFGDQNSIISDSVIMTSSMTMVEPITHVKTQLPYTLIALGLASIGYLILGFIM